jgi:hypothetical protein
MAAVGILSAQTVHTGGPHDPFEIYYDKGGRSVG